MTAQIIKFVSKAEMEQIAVVAEMKANIKSTLNQLLGTKFSPEDLRAGLDLLAEESASALQQVEELESDDTPVGDSGAQPEEQQT